MCKQRAHACRSFFLFYVNVGFFNINLLPFHFVLGQAPSIWGGGEAGIGICMWESDSKSEGWLRRPGKRINRRRRCVILARNMNVVGSSLSSWGRTTFGSFRQELRMLRQRLAALRVDPLWVGPAVEEKISRIRSLNYHTRRKLMMRQRSRIQWLSEGDSNTQFFQRKASARRSKNFISELERKMVWSARTQKRWRIWQMSTMHYMPLKEPLVWKRFCLTYRKGLMARWMPSSMQVTVKKRIKKHDFKVPGESSSAWRFPDTFFPEALGLMWWWSDLYDH